jgi:uncharacterized protein YecT (DUF1311 family)
MAQNPVIRDGKIIGYRCKQCEEVKESMWDDTCRSCEYMNIKHKETMQRLDKLNELLAKVSKDKGVIE